MRPICALLIVLIVASCATLPREGDAAGSESTDSEARVADSRGEADGEAGAEVDERPNARESGERLGTTVASASDEESDPAAVEPDAKQRQASFRLARIERLLPNGVVVLVRAFEYDPAGGRLVEELSKVPGGDSWVSAAYRYEGSTVEITQFAADGKTESVTIRASRNGRLTEEQQLDPAGRVLLGARYEYDDGLLVSWTLSGSDGEILSYSEYSYREGRLVRVDNYDDRGNLQEYLVYEYDDALLSSVEAFDAADGGSLFRTVHSYDGEGRHVAEERTGLGVDRTIRYEYDELDRVSSEGVYDAVEHLLYVERYRYEVVPVGAGDVR